MSLMKISTRLNNSITPYGTSRLRKITVNCILILMNSIVVVLVLSCMGPKGVFAVKFPGEDVYRRVDTPLEVPHDREVSWIYSFDRGTDTRIGVIIQKKEIVWVEIMSRMVRIEPGNQVIYGSIKDLEPGTYQILLTRLADENEIIDSFDFFVYAREDEEEDFVTY